MNFLVIKNRFVEMRNIVKYGGRLKNLLRNIIN